MLPQDYQALLKKKNITAVLPTDEWTDLKFIVAAKERTTLQIFKDVHWAKITILAQAQAVFLIVRFIPIS